MSIYGSYFGNSGLAYMKARYYDPSIGTFVSPDTIVPDAGNVFAYDRYMYVQGRVMNANDPSGHECELAGDDLECVLVAPGQQTSEIEQLNEIRAEMEAEALAADAQAKAEWAQVQATQAAQTAAQANQPALTNSAGMEVTSEGIPTAGEIGTSGVAGESTVGSGNAYSVLYQTKLPDGSYPSSRPAQNQAANQMLLEDMNKDPEFAQQIESVIPRSSIEGPKGGVSRNSPPGWSWHHEDEEGVMSLVPRAQHQAPGPIQELLHPNQSGGYQSWGRPQ